MNWLLVGFLALESGFQSDHSARDKFNIVIFKAFPTILANAIIQLSNAGIKRMWWVTYTGPPDFRLLTYDINLGSLSILALSSGYVTAATRVKHVRSSMIDLPGASNALKDSKQQREYCCKPT
jgi:hypothetical protein